MTGRGQLLQDYHEGVTGMVAPETENLRPAHIQYPVIAAYVKSRGRPQRSAVVPAIPTYDAKVSITVIVGELSTKRSSSTRVIDQACSLTSRASPWSVQPANIV